MPAPMTTRVSPTQAGDTLAKVVRSMLPGVSWNRAKYLCKTGRVLLDDTEALDGAVRVSAGQEVSVDPTGTRRDKRRRHIEVLHLDEHVVVVDKPAGLLSVPYERGDVDTLVHHTRAALSRMEGKRRPPPRVVQRLDKETSGVMVFGRSRLAERELQLQLRAHSVERSYLAIAHGVVRPATHETILLPDRGDGLRGSHGKRFPARGRPPGSGKRSTTHVAMEESLEGATLVRCRLETGRQHQIRIHLSESGHPLLGERVYIREYTGPRLDAPRVMLHAQTLGFVHPVDERMMSFSAPIPEDFTAVLEALRSR